MENSARLFNCARCRQPTIICRDCDRGNIYCNADCSKITRKENVRKASQRYQNTRQGKLNHAARQKRYQQRKFSINKKMTHHPSEEIMPCVSLIEVDETAKQTVSEKICCHFCTKSCSKFMRIDFLRRSTFVLTNKTSIRVRGP